MIKPFLRSDLLLLTWKVIEAVPLKVDCGNALVLASGRSTVQSTIWEENL